MFSAGAPEDSNPKPNTRGHIVNILDFGAIADGRTLCTAAIQAAVNACAKAGGGRVLIPPGRYLTGPIFLKSNIEIEILAGAPHLGSTNFSDYPTMQGMGEGVERNICFYVHRRWPRERLDSRSRNLGRPEFGCGWTLGAKLTSSATSWAL